jgi:hypothetical protein
MRTPGIVSDHNCLAALISTTGSRKYNVVPAQTWNRARLAQVRSSRVTISSRLSSRIDRASIGRAVELVAVLEQCAGRGDHFEGAEANSVTSEDAHDPLSHQATQRGTKRMPFTHQ